MSLESGTTLGPYSVTAKIGEGGMGEVYRARDTKLDRDVALKVLPQTFTEDPTGWPGLNAKLSSGTKGLISVLRSRKAGYENRAVGRLEVS